MGNGVDVQHLIRCYMTPKDLREIANEMDEKIQDARLGDSMVVKEWYGENCIIRFVVDQERMHKHE